jgi:CO/xanthine dehydrogenase FAD-binding subunit
VARGSLGRVGTVVRLPRSLDEAVEALAAAPEAVLLAGGTDLMVDINAGRLRPESVIGLRRVPELRSWYRDNGHVVLGAGLTYTDLEHPDLAALVPGLAQAARTVGSPQIRNAGTLGGNLATASPAGDTLPVLAALDATVTCRSMAGSRELPLAELVTGVKRTTLRSGELIASVRVPVLDGPQEFLKVGTRNAMVISVAGLALVVDRLRHAVHCALGSVGPVPIRAVAAELWLIPYIDWSAGRVPDPRTYETFGQLVADATRPIDDHRSTAAYRRHAIAVCARRALMRALP